MVPLIYVARIPGGKASPSTDDLMQPAKHLIVTFFKEVTEKKLDLGKFDFIAAPLEARLRGGKPKSKQDENLPTSSSPTPSEEASNTAFNQQSFLKSVESTVAKSVESAICKALKPIAKSLDESLKFKMQHDALQLKTQLLLKENESLKVQLKEQKANANEFKTQYFQCAQTLAAKSGNISVKKPNKPLPAKASSKQRSIPASPTPSLSSASVSGSSSSCYSSPDDKSKLFEKFMAMASIDTSRKAAKEKKRSPESKKKRRKL